MDVSAAPPSGGRTGPRRPHTPATLVAALWVPFATVVGVVTSWQVQRIDGDWVDRQQAACRRLSFPTAEHVAAWTGPALGVSAVVVCVLLARQFCRRHGVRLAGTGVGLVAYIGAWPAVLTVPLEPFLLYATYSPVDSGSVLGDCG
ncbi:hypothetical protein ACH4PU_12925 [Streptomyces sp. NPDC021100]|uniref:hypothetical protein n=1 Tax=Streptomyces sp. NPDC021100 TaxID=3365114 RepID=UPI0037B5F89C